MWHMMTQAIQHNSYIEISNKIKNTQEKFETVKNDCSHHNRFSFVISDGHSHDTFHFHS